MRAQQQAPALLEQRRGDPVVDASGPMSPPDAGPAHPEAAAEKPAARQSMLRRVGINSAWLILQPLFLNVVTLLAMGYITRKLGREGYGLFNYGYAYVAAFAAIANLGLRTVAVRGMAEDRDAAPRIFAAFVALRAALAGLVALLALSTASWAPTTPAGRWIIILATIHTTLTLGTQTLGDRFRAVERMRPVAVADMIGGLMLTGLSVLVLALGYGLIGFAVAYLSGAAVGFLMAAWLYLRAFGWPSFSWEWPTVRGLARQARPFVVMQLVTGVTDRPCIDLLLVNSLMGPAVLGPYAAAAVLVNRLGVIPEGVTNALFPAVAGGYQARREEVEQTVRKAILYLLLVTLPLAAGVSFLAPLVVRVLFGPAYADAAGVLAALIWVVPLLGPNLLMYDCLSAVHRQNVAAAITLGGGLVQIALYAITIPVYGPAGAAASTVAREILLFLVLWREMSRSFRNPIPFRSLARAGLALAALALPMALAAGSASLALRVGCAAVGVLLYGLGLLKLKVL